MSAEASELKIMQGMSAGNEFSTNHFPFVNQKQEKHAKGHFPCVIAQRQQISHGLTLRTKLPQDNLVFILRIGYVIFQILNDQCYAVIT